MSSSTPAPNDAERRVLARHASQRNQETAGTLAAAPAPAKEKKPALAFWKHSVAGAVAGVCEVLGTMPLDVAKTNMQMHPGKYSGPIDCLMKISKQHGPAAMYNGTTPFMLQTAGKAAIRFTAFAQIKLVLEFLQVPTPMVNLWSGLLAGAVEAAVWTTPTERIKVLRQTEVVPAGQASKYANIVSASRHIVQTQGVGGMFVGLVPTSIRQASSVGVRMALYPSVKALFPENGGVAANMASGGIVGGLSVILNNPVDVIKSISQSGQRINPETNKPYKGLVECSKLIYSESGVQGFGRGLTARVPRVFCGQAITFAMYEQVADLLSRI